MLVAGVGVHAGPAPDRRDALDDHQVARVATVDALDPAESVARH